MRQFRDWVMNPDEAELLAAVRPQRKRKRKKKAKPGDALEDTGIVLLVQTQNKWW